MWALFLLLYNNRPDNMVVEMNQKVYLNYAYVIILI